MKPKAAIELLVTDLDNTLYDWVTFFVVAFYAMVGCATRLLDVPEDVLLDDLRSVHQHHHNSEQPFALLDTDTVARRFPGMSRRQRAVELDPAFKAFNSVRDRALVVYPGVTETLAKIADSGCTIVGHTEASIANARFRLTKLRLARFFTGLYATQDRGAGHPAPERALPMDALPVVRTVVMARRKPDPDLLLEICDSLHTAPEHALYVGDSLTRDVGMARAAGTWSAWAEYGTRYAPELWDKLVRVTHWTEEDRLRARIAHEHYGHAQPHVVLHDGFSELLDHYAFGPQRAGR